LRNTHLAPLAQALEAELVHAGVRETLPLAAGQADGAVGRRRGALCGGVLLRGGCTGPRLTVGICRIVRAGGSGFLGLVVTGLTAAFGEIGKLHGRSRQSMGSGIGSFGSRLYDHRGAHLVRSRIGHIAGIAARVLLRHTGDYISTI